MNSYDVFPENFSVMKVGDLFIQTMAGQGGNLFYLVTNTVTGLVSFTHVYQVPGSPEPLDITTNDTQMHIPYHLRNDENTLPYILEHLMSMTIPMRLQSLEAHIAALPDDMFDVIDIQILHQIGGDFHSADTPYWLEISRLFVIERERRGIEVSHG